MANIANTVIINPNQDPAIALGPNSLSDLIANGNVSQVYQARDNTYINVVEVQATSQYVSATTNFPAGNTGDIQFKYGSDFGASSGLRYDISNSVLIAYGIQTNVSTTANLNVSNLTVTGTANLGNVSNVILRGGLDNQVLTTIDQANGTLGWTFVSGAGGIVGGNVSNITVVDDSVSINFDVAPNVFVVTANGANLTGNLNVSNNLTTANLFAQNITANGNVTFTGPVITFSNVANLRIPGGSNGQYLQTDGNGNIRFANAAGFADRIVSGNSNLVLAPNSNATFSIAGNANVLVVTGTGANITGTANVTGNVEVGGNLTVAGITTLGNVGNVKITGGDANQFLQTDGTGNVTWANTPIPNGIYNGNSNVVASANGVINVAVSGVANVAVFDVNKVRVGINAGSNAQSNNAIAIGANAATTAQSNNAVAIGQLAGNNTQGLSAISIGNSAGLANQATRAIAIGDSAGSNLQGPNAIAIGYSAGATQQGYDGIALGYVSGFSSQSPNAVAIGKRAGFRNQGDSSVSVGQSAGEETQGAFAVAIGLFAGTYNQGNYSIGIGSSAGDSRQGANSVAIGRNSGANNQGANSVAIGLLSANLNQGIQSVAIGAQAGQLAQSNSAIAIGSSAGGANQGFQSVAIGYDSGNVTQGANSIAVGPFSGSVNQSNGAVAIGLNAGANAQGLNSIAIGANAGANQQSNNSIVLNASGNILNGNNSGFYVAPVRSANATSNVLYYDTTTNEITFAPPSSVSNVSTVANGSSSINIPATNANIIVTVGGNLLGNFTGTGLVINRISTTNNQVGLGNNAGSTGQLANAIAIGTNAGVTTQGANSVAIGLSAGQTSQGANAVAIGVGSGSNSQGAGAIAIGANAGANGQAANSIIISAGANTITASANSLYVDPIRGGASAANVLYYNPTTKEITYDAAASGSAISNGTSNVSIAVADGPVTVGIGGTSNIAIISNTGANITGTLTATGNITTNANLIVNSSITANGNANIGAALSVGTNASITGNLSVSGIANITGNITSLANISGSFIIASNNFNTTANVNAGNVLANGNIIGNTLTVNNSATINGNIDAGADINVSGGNIDVNGAVIADNIESVNDLIVGGNANITFDLNVSNNANITGNISGNNANLLGNLTLRGITANGIVQLGDVSNLNIGGGTANYFLQTDGSGGLSWVAPGSGLANGTSSITIPVAGGNINVNPGGTPTVDFGQNVTIFNTEVEFIGPGAGSDITFSNISNIDANGATFYSSFIEVSDDVFTTGGAFNAANNFVAYANGRIEGGTNNFLVTDAGNLFADYLNANNGANLGNVSTLRITGGSANQFLQTNGGGILQFSNVISNLSNGTPVAFTPGADIVILGTPNQVIANLTASTFRLSTPQDIATTSNVQFRSLGAGVAPSANAGEIIATGNIIAFFSDDRLKDRVGNIENALDKIDNIATFYFYPNKIAQDLGYANALAVGVSAQDTQRQMPEIVCDAPIGNGYLTVQYEKFAPLVLAAIKELRAEINDIKKKLG